MQATRATLAGLPAASSASFGRLFGGGSEAARCLGLGGLRWTWHYLGTLGVTVGRSNRRALRGEWLGALGY